MSNPPTTRYSLLVRLCQPADEHAWQEFVEIYEPFVYRLARRRGFQHADAADLCQEVFQATSRAIERWHARTDRGTFRAWLFRIARNIMINAVRFRQRHPTGVGGSEIWRLIDQQPADDDHHFGRRDHDVHLQRNEHRLDHHRLYRRLWAEDADAGLLHL